MANSLDFDLCRRNGRVITPIQSTVDDVRHDKLRPKLSSSSFPVLCQQHRTGLIMTIYRSSYPDVPIVHRSVFTQFLGVPKPGYVGHWPGSQPAFTDAVTGTTITRSQTRSLALSLGFGLKNYPGILAKRGDIALVYSPNSLAWPVVIFGCTSPRALTGFLETYGIRKALRPVCVLAVPTVHILVTSSHSNTRTAAHMSSSLRMKVLQSCGRCSSR